MIKAFLLTMVCHGTPVTADNCSLYQQQSWEATPSSLQICVTMAEDLTKLGQAARCEVADAIFDEVEEGEEGEPNDSADTGEGENNYLAQMGQSWRI